jgi:hypothetical protein
MNSSGVSAVGAGIAFIISGACIAVFFTTEEEAWGRANDATIASFAALMIPPVLEIYDRYAKGERWIAALPTLLGVAGLLIVVVTSGLTALAKLDWLLSAKIGAFGFGGFLAWMIWVSTLILRRGGLPDALAWFGVATAGVVGMAVAMSIRFIRIHGSLSGNVQPPVELWVVLGIAFLCLATWTIWLGLSLS